MHLKRIENIFIIFILVHKYLPIGKIFSRFVLYKPCHSASKAPVTYCLLFVFEALGIDSKQHERIALT